MAKEYEILAHKNIVRSELEEVIAKVAEFQGWSVGEPEKNNDKIKKVFVLKKFFKRLRIKIPFSGQSRDSDLINQISYSYNGGFMNFATRNDAVEYIRKLTEEIDSYKLLQDFGQNNPVQQKDYEL